MNKTIKTMDTNDLPSVCRSKLYFTIFSPTKCNNLNSNKMVKEKGKLEWKVINIKSEKSKFNNSFDRWCKSKIILNKCFNKIEYFSP